MVLGIFAWQGFVDWRIAILFILGGVLGAIIGNLVVFAVRIMLK